MIRRAMLVGALVVAGLTATAIPAQAIPVGPSMVVWAYFSDSSKTQLVGQVWSAGCGPAGSWGTTSGYRTIYFTAC
ncbi:hypothetical protein Lfu02_45860 [Longispora fulva]|uniref:Uncharacterized protein n=1 Tax=Longispora fulva TaxID=619741 RepID=A0A8J7KLG9_9ACTN|nr:DUF6289 family protein [Longispora fulva]MBG6137961.1 hypothetical protein [Longispora fulva]GIG60214.1 hypothetical protein Lfu02_45860 [Longispora fulva]